MLVTVLSLLFLTTCDDSNETTDAAMVVLGHAYRIAPVAFDPPYEPVVVDALGLNDAGVVVGWYSGIDLLPFVYENGVMETPHVGSSAVVSDINNGGQMVGSVSGCYFGAGPVLSRGFLWAGDGDPVFIDFPGLTNDPFLCLEEHTFAHGINDQGQIVGAFKQAGGGTHGFLLDDGVFTQIDVPGAESTELASINNEGQIVGTFTDASGTHGFFLDGGIFTQIDAPGATSTQALDINDAGQIVGTMMDTAGTHGFLMDGDAVGLFDIPGATRTAGEGINNLGQLVGSFVVPQEAPDTGSSTRAYLAIP
jgi:probable HAF family extracellular repeat protein